eukprot:Nitzschia sp. Nitz4//scaffold7_size249615//54853//57987//NITZ4_001153-RA/size249615-processed-gene-0.182-mRNA-1//-1//CDS//3329558370//4404//frame0
MTKNTDTSLIGGGAYLLVSALYIVGFLNLLYQACLAAYDIRLYAINEYGRVIHEFDPYFNYRAAEYLWANGWRRFFQWFDYMSWYPLGRPVGSTIYPGMQFTSVWIKQFILPSWSINDICCYVPVWFGVLATLATAGLCYTTVSSTATTKGSRSMLTDVPVVSDIVKLVILPIVTFVTNLLKQLTGSTWGLPTLQNPPALESAVFAATIMSIVPAHLLRSVGGGYDNESVATFAMQITFWTWTMTLASSNLIQATVLGVISAFCYVYMVAAWGGYVFVINLVGLHAVAVFLLRKLPFDHLYCSYSSFYLVGTFLAIQIPVVGWTPIKSLEQMGPLLVFLGFQAIQLMSVLERKYTKVNKWQIRVGVVLAGLVAASPVVYWLYSTGYFGPISSRVRGLFVKHTKTGNPLVDSVAEHQAASPQAYFQYLHKVMFLAPVGFAIVGLFACTAASSFLVVYGVAAYFFSHRMVRLILLTAPIASICAGIALGYAWAWAAGAIFGDARPTLELFFMEDEPEEKKETTTDEVVEEPKPTPGKKNKKKGKKPAATNTDDDFEIPTEKNTGDPIWVRVVRLIIAFYAIREMLPHVEEFKSMCQQVAQGISHPTIITKGRNPNTGEVVVVDDYRQAYLWLKDNTPEDARVMAWWDYGYQITGISNRTTIADGNTWNHEHIALLGRALTSSEVEGHRIARHLADYILVWAGGGGDDLAKSPHLRRIANSVYRGLCREPTCRGFGMSRSGPTPSLAGSMLYKLHSNGLVEGVAVDRNRFREVFRSKYGKVRIYKVMSVSQESKDWVINNRVCDAPGSWFCPGHYPPALEKILEEKRDFAQLEDFNAKSRDEEYQKQYFEHLNNPNARGGEEPRDEPPRKEERAELRQLSQEEIEAISSRWGDTEETSTMWEIISEGNMRDFIYALSEFPNLAYVRSADGRGPLWWAHEYNRPRMVDILKRMGVSDEWTDAAGKRPSES